MLRTKAGIYVPPSVEHSGVELRQAFICTICKASFHDGERGAYEHHVAKCAQQNMEELRASSPRVIAPGIMGDAGVDVEYRDYLRKRYG